MVNQIKYPLAESPVIEEDSQKIVKIRHTCAHILAMAVQTLFPETKVAIGPWMASFIGSAKMNGVDPYAYLLYLFTRLAQGHLNKDIDALMPWTYAASSNPSQ